MKTGKSVLIEKYGILTGQEFANKYQGWGIPEDVKKILLEGPDNSEYAETWKNFVATTSHEYNGATYTLEQGEDYVLYMIYPEEENNEQASS